MKSIATSLIVIALVSICGCMSIGPDHGDCAPYTYRITGQLLDAKTSQPLGNTPVFANFGDARQLMQPHATELPKPSVPRSDDSGHFEVTILTGGGPSYRMRLFGFIPVGYTGAGGKLDDLKKLTVTAYAASTGWNSVLVTLNSRICKEEDTFTTCINTGIIRIPSETK